MRSMLPLLKERAQTLLLRIEGMSATLDLLSDCGMNTKEHSESLSYLRLRYAAIAQDIAILEQGYALKGVRNVPR